MTEFSVFLFLLCCKTFFKHYLGFNTCLTVSRIEFISSQENCWMERRAVFHFSRVWESTICFSLRLSLFLGNASPSINKVCVCACVLDRTAAAVFCQPRDHSRPPSSDIYFLLICSRITLLLLLLS